MKPAIKIPTTVTTAILGCTLAAGWAWAQSPSVSQNTRNTMNGVSQNAAAASNEVLGIKQPSVKQSGGNPSGASAQPAATQASGVGVVGPSKPAAPSGSSASHTSAKKSVRTKRVTAVVAEPSVQPKQAGTDSKSARQAAATVAAGSGDGENQSEQPVDPDSKAAANGRRDPFLSPVVSHANTPGCSAGRKCLDIGTISLRGVVHAESGFIAVVSNGLNKAYFLRENDPVFNGYVTKITGDSIVFKETVQDRLGKTFTREVVKKITAPAV